MGTHLRLALTASVVATLVVAGARGATRGGIGGVTPHSHPAEITAGPDGNLWFTESGVSKIGQMTAGK